MQLAQVQVVGARLITELIKATSIQALNIKAYLTHISLELDKEIDQIAICVYSGLLYHMVVKGRYTHLRRIFILLDVLKKQRLKLFDDNICKLEKNLLIL